MIQIDCTVCGQRHRVGDCPGVSKAAKRERLVIPVLTSLPPEKLQEMAAAIPENQKRDALRDGYNAYMREYMRKRRAKEKK